MTEIASVLLHLANKVENIDRRQVLGIGLPKCPVPQCNSTEITDGCGVGHDGVGHYSCRVSDACMRDRPNISSASSTHVAKRHGGLYQFNVAQLFL